MVRSDTIKSIQTVSDYCDYSNYSDPVWTPHNLQGWLFNWRVAASRIASASVHYVFKSIVALHSFRLKLCSVKYIVHWPEKCQGGCVTWGFRSLTNKTRKSNSHWHILE